jgi:cellulose biosynthesis protein BcsQ
MTQKNFIPGIRDKVINVAIISPDLPYKGDLIDYYANDNGNIVLTNAGETLDVISELESIDILILEQLDSPDFQNQKDLLKLKGIRKVIYITKQISDIQNPTHDSLDFQYIYKYSSYEQITQLIILSHFNSALQESHNPAFKETIKAIQKQKKVVFYSPKGGTGKTMAAVNTACQLALKEHRVLLVEFSQFSAFSVLFQITKSNNLGQAISLLEQQGAQDEDIIEAMTEAINEVEILPEKNLSVLAAGSHFKMANLTLSMTDKLLSLIQSLDFDIIICDTSSEISPKNISLLSWATDLFLITSTDVVVNWQLFTSQDFLQQIQNPFQSQHLLLNKFSTSYSIKQDEVEQILSKKVAEIIPDFESQLQNYINRGMLLTSKPGLKIHKHFKRIAHLIQPVFTDKELGLKKKRFRRRGVTV